MTEDEVLNAISEGDSAYSLLIDKDKNLEKRWRSICKSLKEFLKSTKLHFPDAQYYTASGGFNLMLGNPHNKESQKAQQELVALQGIGVYIGDGDF